MDLVLSELMMLLLFIILPITVVITIIILIRNWMVNQTKLKEEQNSLLKQIIDQKNKF
jgi:hypothetical protein